MVLAQLAEAADGITIPFPICTADFGIEGGAPLDAMPGNGRIGAKESQGPEVRA